MYVKRVLILTLYIKKKKILVFNDMFSPRHHKDLQLLVTPLPPPAQEVFLL